MTNKSLTKRDYLNIAWKRNMLFHTDAQYEKLLNGKRKPLLSDPNTSQRTIDAAYNILNRECEKLHGECLNVLIDNYVEASKRKIDDECWRCKEGDLFDIRAMKKFCRWYFRARWTPDADILPCDPIDRSNFWEIYRKFDNGDSIFFLMLLVWDVIPLHNSDSEHSRQQRVDRAKQIKNMRRMVEDLLDDTDVEIGITEKPLVFQNILGELNHGLELIETKRWSEDEHRFTALWFRTQLLIIVNACEIACSPYAMNKLFISTHRYWMPGIWVDDTDREAQHSFWVFPENKSMAFRYSHRAEENSLVWQLDVFDFALSAPEYEPSNVAELCLFVTTEGNQQIIEHKGNYISEDQIASVKHIVHYDKDDEVERIEFHSTNPIPEFMKWRQFERLNNPSRANELYRFLEIFNKKGTPSDIYEDVTLINKSSVQTDTKNSLVGIDFKNLYVSDNNEVYSEEVVPQFYLHEAMPESRSFKCLPKHDLSSNIFAIEISREHPLYCIPRKVKVIDKSSTSRHSESTAKNGVDDREFKAFKEMVAVTRMDDQVTICNHNKICFNKQSRFFDIDTIMKHFGVRKFTSRADLIQALGK